MADHVQPDPVVVRRLRRAFRKLPRRTREIFLAHRLDELSYEEIARRTGLKVPEVERHMAKALCCLSRALDDEPVRWRRRLLRR